MKLLDRLHKLAAFVPECGTKSIVYAGVIWIQLIFSVLVLFGAGVLRDFWRRVPRPTNLEMPRH